MRIYFLILFIIILLFAVKREITDSKDCYIECMPVKSDSNKKLYTKLNRCLQYNKVCIKWRRSMIYAVISTFIIFFLVYFRLPETKELILFIFIMYIVYYYMWINFTDTVGKNAENISKDILKILKK